MEFLAPQDNRCFLLVEPVYIINTIVSIIILLGILVSYLPQHHRIISRRTSEGISPYFILLGMTSSTSSIANIFLLPSSREDMQCCKVVGPLDCFAGLLGIAQVSTQWFCFAIILLLFFIFFPRGLAVPRDTIAKQYTFRIAVAVTSLCVLHALVIIVITAIVAVSFPNRLFAWANTLGLMSASLAAVQYLPQIWTTYSLGHVGSLSLPMMVIQTPGSFVWAGSLFARLGWGGWSAWGVFLVTGCLQACLLAMGICFELRARIEKQAVNGLVTPNGAVLGDTDGDGTLIENEHHTERTPLLRN